MLIRVRLVEVHTDKVKIMGNRHNSNSTLQHNMDNSTKLINKVLTNKVMLNKVMLMQIPTDKLKLMLTHMVKWVELDNFRSQEKNKCHTTVLHLNLSHMVLQDRRIHQRMLKQGKYLLEE